MRRSTQLFLAFVAVALTTACASTAPAPGPEAGGSPETSAPSARSDPRKADKKGTAQEPEWGGPNFVVTTFEGERFELAAQAGHPVVLNFWESW